VANVCDKSRDILVSVRFFREKCNFSCRTDRSERNKWLRYRQSTIDSACLNDIKKITKFGRFFKAVQRKNKNALNRYFIIVIMYLKKEGTASRPNLYITTDIIIKQG
jgi:hypothetical protein